jgi:LysR family cyn operon transcriptional activator
MLLRHLRYLLAVAEHGNFTRAAEALHVSQPTLSLQIRQLEEALGTPLLDRSSRTVRPTDTGLVYLEHARRALRELAAGERAIHDVRSLQRGALRLAMTPTLVSYLTGPLVAGFHARHPGITLQLDEMTLDAMLHALADDALDIGIAFAAGGLADPAELACQPLFTEQLSVVVGAAHPLAHCGAPLAPRQLDGAALAMLHTSFVTRSHIDAYFQAQQVRPRVAIETGTIGSLLELVNRGGVATLLPRALTAGYPGLRAVALDPPVPPRTVAMMFRRDGYRSAAAAAFIELAPSLLPGAD